MGLPCKCRTRVPRTSCREIPMESVSARTCTFQIFLHPVRAACTEYRPLFGLVPWCLHRRYSTYVAEWWMGTSSSFLSSWQVDDDVQDWKVHSFDDFPPEHWTWFWSLLVEMILLTKPNKSTPSSTSTETTAKCFVAELHRRLSSYEWRRIYYNTWLFSCADVRVMEDRDDGADQLFKNFLWWDWRHSFSYVVVQKLYELSQNQVVISDFRPF